MKVYMVKSCTAILISALLLTLIMPAALADTGSGTITGSAVNLRKSPGGLVIGLVRRGDVVTVEGTEGGYIQIVTVSGKRGFVYKQYIDITEQPDIGQQNTELILKKGSRGSDVVSLQTRLKELGFYTYSKITGYFGSITHDALVRFQTNAGLTANGIADSATLTALCADDTQQNDDGTQTSFNVNQTLKVGSRGDDVKTLQTRLKELGFYTYSKITGYFGSITRDALIRFQTDGGLTANGVADSVTLTALFDPDSQPSEPETQIAFNVNQTLQVGVRSDDVTALQTRLKELGFYTYSKITGYFGSITRDAVMRFQQDAGLAQTGIADPATLSRIFGIEADPTAEPAYAYIAMRTDITLKKGRTGDDVRDMQTALLQKGFYSGPINGRFDTATLYAVMAFQRAMSLKVDGLAGNYTLSALYSLLSPPAEAPTPGRFDKGALLPIEMPTWSEACDIMPRNTNIIIVDVLSGFTFEACRTGGTLHADVEPLYAIDTATIYAMYGGQWSWERRPIWVLANGHRMAASMNGMPHGYDTLPDNDMQGQFCVHFVGCRTHGTRKTDPDHQACIEQAYQAALK